MASRQTHRARPGSTVTTAGVTDVQRHVKQSYFHPLVVPKAVILDPAATLETRPPLPAQDVLAGKLLVHLDDPQHPSHQVDYVVHLK